MRVTVVKCAMCGWAANVDEATSLVWRKAANLKGELINMVVCRGNGRRPCGVLLKPKTIEVKGLKRLRSRKSR